MTNSPPAPIATTFATKMDLAVEVPVEYWIDLLAGCDDMFAEIYCGYWLRHVGWDAKRGHIAWENNDRYAWGKEPNRKQAIAAWHKGADEPLPKGWYRLDQRAAVKAFCEGVRLWGVEWMDSDHNDARGYDVVIQMALLGEHRYEP